MKPTAAVLIGSLLAFGCQTQRNLSSDDVSQEMWKRIETLAREPAPMSATTPFGAGSVGESLYQSGFKAGWAATLQDLLSTGSAKGGIGSSGAFVQGSGTETAWNEGYQAAPMAILKRLTSQRSETQAK